MTTNAFKKINYLDQLKSRAWIDFLISYDSINVYQIWNSVFNKVIWIKNIIFNEKTVFNDNIETARLELKKTQTAQNMSLDKLVKLLQQLNEMKTTR